MDGSSKEIVKEILEEIDVGNSKHVDEEFHSKFSNGIAKWNQ